MRLRTAVATFALGSLAACVDADYGGTEFSCDASAPICPDDMACVAGVCTAFASPDDPPGPGRGDGAPGAGGPDAFADDFDRPDSFEIGNGWVESSPAAFELRNGTLAHRVPGLPPRERYLYRPEAEDARDVEAGIDIVYDGIDDRTRPQIHLRVQRESSALTGYVTYVDGDDALVIDRLVGGDAVRQARIAIDDPNPGDLYRLSARIAGTDPVRISATWEHRRENGTSVKTTSTQDDSSSRITAPGALGLAADVEANDFVYDNWHHERTR